MADKPPGDRFDKLGIPKSPSEAEINKRGASSTLTWNIAAGDDGLRKDCIMVATMEGAEMQSISLHLAQAPAPE